MTFAIDHLQMRDYPAINRAASVVKEWLGRGVNWTQTQAKNVPISIKDPYLAGISLVAGNFLIFQVALRIANHIDPRHNYIISSRNRTQ